MTDLEITRLCAEAMCFTLDFDSVLLSGTKFDPLHDDAQAMALVKKFELMIAPPMDIRGNRWFVSD